MQVSQAYNLEDREEGEQVRTRAHRELIPRAAGQGILLPAEKGTPPTPSLRLAAGQAWKGPWPQGAFPQLSQARSIEAS